MNKVIDSMLAHRSIRSYTDRTVSDEDLNSIIRAVQAAPNWVNLQLVSIIAVKNTDHRRRLAELCGNQVHIAEAPVFLVFCTDYHRVALACHKKEQTLDEVMQDIDTLLVGAHEVGIALEAAVVAAESLGLGTVPIGDVRKNALEIVHELQLPEYVFPMLGLCIGYPAEEPGLKPRFPQQAVFFEETYKTDLKDKLYNTSIKLEKVKILHNRLFEESTNQSALLNEKRAELLRYKAFRDLIIAKQLENDSAGLSYDDVDEIDNRIFGEID